MKRLVLALILLGALLTGSPSSIHAQQMVYIDVEHTVAITTCVRSGKRYEPVSVINMAYLDSSIAQSVIEHERVHLNDYLADPTLCRDLMAAKNAKSDRAFRRALAVWMPRVLAMELHAYCATADAEIKRGHMSSTALYLDDLSRMQAQFAGQFTDEEIRTAWFNACGRLLK